MIMRKQNGERKCSSMCCYALCFNPTEEILLNQHWYALQQMIGKLWNQYIADLCEDEVRNVWHESTEIIKFF